jgi:hypothetical protein
LSGHEAGVETGGYLILPVFFVLSQQDLFTNDGSDVERSGEFACIIKKKTG